MTCADQPADPDRADWHALHARPRCEKKLADYLAGISVEHYLPLRTETKIYQRRKVVVQRPLFSGYVFACFDLFQRILVLKSQQIVRDLPVRDQARFLVELDQVRRALAVNPALSACPAVTKGSRVRILAGPFQGLEGVVVKIRQSTRVILNVDSIGQGVAVEVDAEMLELA